jgi:AmmeMemoRadiSam system protein B
MAAVLQLRGAAITTAHLRTFLQRLDEAGFLDSARAEHHRRQRVEEFRARPARPAVHAGGAYPDGMRLRPFLEAGYRHAEGPGGLPRPMNPSLPPPRGVIAPHVDLHRGAPTYSWAYKAIAEARPADLYVVLGTCHTGVDGAFAATLKPYETPLGVVPADAAFTSRLQRLWGYDLQRGEFAHATEHSIEFQAVYLRSLRITAPMVPIMCDSLHSLVPYGATPTAVPIVADFVSALHDAIVADGRAITVIAAVDLAHIGQRFGDAWLVDADRQRATEIADRETVALALQPDAEGYYAQVMRDRDARRICGFTPIYLLSALMGKLGGAGELLRYTQWVDRDLSSSVTFVSALYP